MCADVSLNVACLLVLKMAKVREERGRGNLRHQIWLDIARFFHYSPQTTMLASSASDSYMSGRCFTTTATTSIGTWHCLYFSSKLCSTTLLLLHYITMLSRSAALVARKIVLPRTTTTAATTTATTRLAAAAFSSEAAADATSVTLNLSVPHESIYNGTAVDSVIIPGTEGEYGITAGHVPYVAQMKPGVLQVLFEGAEPEKYFVAGGYAVTHANSVTVSIC